jgi:hypothetical protein
VPGDARPPPAGGPDRLPSRLGKCSTICDVPVFPTAARHGDPAVASPNAGWRESLFMAASGTSSSTRQYRHDRRGRSSSRSYAPPWRSRQLARSPPCCGSRAAGAASSNLPRTASPPGEPIFAAARSKVNGAFWRPSSNAFLGITVAAIPGAFLWGLPQPRPQQPPHHCVTTVTLPSAWRRSFRPAEDYRRRRLTAAIHTRRRRSRDDRTRD